MIIATLRGGRSIISVALGTAKTCEGEKGRDKTEGREAEVSTHSHGECAHAVPQRTQKKTKKGIKEGTSTQASGYATIARAHNTEIGKFQSYEVRQI